MNFSTKVFSALLLALLVGILSWSFLDRSPDSRKKSGGSSSFLPPPSSLPSHNKVKEPLKPSPEKKTYTQKVQTNLDKKSEKRLAEFLKKASGSLSEKEKADLVQALLRGTRESSPGEFRRHLEDLIREFPEILPLLVPLFEKVNHRDHLFFLAQILQQIRTPKEIKRLADSLKKGDPLHREMAIYALLFSGDATVAQKVGRLYLTGWEKEKVRLAASFYLEKNFAELSAKKQREVHNFALTEALADGRPSLRGSSLLLASAGGLTPSEAEDVRDLVGHKNPTLGLRALEALVKSKSLDPLKMRGELSKILKNLPPLDPRKKVLESWLKK